MGKMRLSLTTLLHSPLTDLVIIIIILFLLLFSLSMETILTALLTTRYCLSCVCTSHVSYMKIDTLPVMLNTVSLELITMARKCSKCSE